jgi:hypothetical protein
MSTSQENICKISIVSIQIRIFSLIPEFGYHFDKSSLEKQTNITFKVVLAGDKIDGLVIVLDHIEVYITYNWKNVK